MSPSGLDSVLKQLIILLLFGWRPTRSTSAAKLVLCSHALAVHVALSARVQLSVEQSPCLISGYKKQSLLMESEGRPWNRLRRMGVIMIRAEIQ